MKNLFGYLLISCLIGLLVFTGVHFHTYHNQGGNQTQDTLKVTIETVRVDTVFLPPVILKKWKIKEKLVFADKSDSTKISQHFLADTTLTNIGFIQVDFSLPEETFDFRIDPVPRVDSVKTVTVTETITKTVIEKKRNWTEYLMAAAVGLIAGLLIK